MLPPVEILILPWSTQTSNLEVEHTIILEEVIDLTHEGAEFADTNVLSHLQTGDLVVLLTSWQITVVLKKHEAQKIRDRPRQLSKQQTRQGEAQ